MRLVNPSIAKEPEHSPPEQYAIPLARFDRDTADVPQNATDFAYALVEDPDIEGKSTGGDSTTEVNISVPQTADSMYRTSVERTLPQLAWRR